MLESANQKALRFLGIALAVSVVIAFPMEEVTHSFYAPGSYWLNNSCGSVVALLNLGVIVQAALTPFLVFLLPGAGSIFQRKMLRSSSRRPPQPALFFAVGWLCAAAIPVAWWHGLRHYAVPQGACPTLFDLDRPLVPFQVDLVSDCSHYFIYVSVFAALWVGITASGLRLQSARAAEGASSASEPRQFQDFYWVYLLGWAVQYRLGQWLMLATVVTNQEWVTYAAMSFVCLTTSSLWSLAFVRFAWRQRPRTRLTAVILAFCGTFLICMLTALSFVWLFFLAGVALVPLLTLNVSGLAWSATVGTWRWRALQHEPPVMTAAAAIRSRGKGPALLGLRVLEIVAIVFAGLLILAAAAGFLFWIFYVYKDPNR